MLDPDEEGGFGASVLIVIWVISGLAWFATIIQLISTQLAHHAENLGKTVEEGSLLVLFLFISMFIFLCSKICAICLTCCAQNLF